jgi:hypothetical protein
MDWALERQQAAAIRAVTIRAGGLGGAAGLILGGGIGTCLFPLVGTAIGGFVGVNLGLAFGIVNGLALAAVREISTARWAVRVAGALTSVGCAIATIAIAFPPWPHRSNPLELAFIAICAGLGIALAPIAINGDRLLRADVQIGRRSVPSFVRRTLAVGGIGGGGLGAIAGLSIGLAAYPPTAAAAVVEGGIIGGVCCLVIAAFVASIFVMSKQQVRR